MTLAARIRSGIWTDWYVTDAGFFEPLVCALHRFPGSGVENRTTVIKPVLGSVFPYGFDVDPP